jgi:ATP-dependent RNA helicase RhlB
MNMPERFSVTPEQVTVEQIEQEIYHVGKDEKVGLLLGLLRREPDGRYLIFCNMKSTAERLGTILNANGYRTSSITGDIPQKKRMRVLSGFKEGLFPILVATDVASRGLHIEGVTHVINYDLPQDPEDYVHRIGRTARAGAGGKAISLACEDYVHSLPDIEEFIKQKIPLVPVTDELIVTGYKRAARKPPRVPAPQRRKGGERSSRDKGKSRPRSSRDKEGARRFSGKNRKKDGRPPTTDRRP